MTRSLQQPRFRPAALMLATALVVACAPVPLPEASDSHTSARQLRQLQMRERWSGCLYVELVEEMGYSGESMTTPSISGMTHSAVTFGVNDSTSGCLDSFVIINGDEPLIDTYHCR